MPNFQLICIWLNYVVIIQIKLVYNLYTMYKLPCNLDAQQETFTFDCLTFQQLGTSCTERLLECLIQAPSSPVLFGDYMDS